jgi:predicted nucleic acid-binding protein
MRLLVDVLLAHDIPCLTNAYAAEEARRNITAHYPQHLAGLRALLPQLSLVDRLVAKLEITLKPKDVPILYAAVAGKATHLLTCDVADFGEIMRRPYRHLKVVTPVMLARELKKLGII